MIGILLSLSMRNIQAYVLSYYLLLFSQLVIYYNRQFFRLVTSEVSLWFEEHSTKNPPGVVPDPNITKIVKGSKFNKGEAYIASDTCN